MSSVVARQLTHRTQKELKLEYLLRIDALSTPSLDPEAGGAAVAIEEDTPGFLRLRVRDIESWAEFLGPTGRLRRDLVKARLSKLLATAAKQGQLICSLQPATLCLHIHTTIGIPLKSKTVRPIQSTLPRFATKHLGALFES